MTAQVRSYASFGALDATPDTFNLDAGKYGVTVHATVWGTAALQRVLPGPILVTVLVAFAADGYAVVELPAGKYQMTLAGVTALTGAVEQIAPGRMGG